MLPDASASKVQPVMVQLNGTVNRTVEPEVARPEPPPSQITCFDSVRARRAAATVPLDILLPFREVSPLPTAVIIPPFKSRGVAPPVARNPKLIRRVLRSVVLA